LRRDYVTEPSVGKEPQTAWQMLKPDFGWLGHLVSWKTIIAAILVLGVAVGLFIMTGGVNVAADEPDSFLARNVLHFVFKNSVGSRARGIIAPDDLAAPTRVRLAAQHFDMVCANCHGRPGFGQSVVALSMSPRPQDLPKVIDQFTPAELYLIVNHGVKYSAMPSWPTGQRADEVWSMVAFLRQLPNIDAKSYREMTALPEQAGSLSLELGDDATLRPANAQRNTPPTNEFLYAAPASGFSDANIHMNPAATCARCHGADGTGAVTGGEAPNLTIQDASYLRASLQAYVSGSRKSGFMQNIAAQLSSAEVGALSDYYAGLAVQTIPSPQADPALAKRGETIASEGIRERAVPACANCHESDGTKVTGAPHIAGQSATFLRRQLGALRLGGRGSVADWNPMAALAHDLSDNDIAALAAYYSGLKPAKGAASAQLAQLPHVTLPQGDVGKAKQIFETRCVKCHDNEGRGDKTGGFPDLTLQSAPYVAQSLFSFRTHKRNNDKMVEVTGSLNLDELTSLANYINGLAPQKALAVPDADAASRGAIIATKGAPDRNVPACITCHDAKNISALPLIPRLQGQSPVYLRNKLDEFFKAYETDPLTLNPMPAIVRQLTEREREDLAAYFAEAEPLAKAAAQP
jgi:cytochrome c553